MLAMRVVIFSVVVISACNASGIGHIVPAVKSYPVVRYAPFYNFPGLVRSIHAVGPAPLPAPVLPVPLPAPVFPTRAIVPALPAPAPLLPAPISPAVLPASPVAPVFTPAFGPSIATAALSAYTPALAPSIAHAVAPAPYFTPVLPKLASTIPALPAPIFRSVAALPPAPFAPVVRPVVSALPEVAPAYPAPLFAPGPGPIAVAKAFPYGIAPYAPLGPIVKDVAWK